MIWIVRFNNNVKYKTVERWQKTDSSNSDFFMFPNINPRSIERSWSDKSGHLFFILLFREDQTQVHWKKGRAIRMDTFCFLTFPRRPGAGPLKKLEWYNWPPFCFGHITDLQSVRERGSLKEVSVFRMETPLSLQQFHHRHLCRYCCWPTGPQRNR